MVVAELSNPRLIPFLPLLTLLMGGTEALYPQTNPTNPYTAPLYWSVYEYHSLRERTGLPGSMNYIPESELAANVDMVESKLKPFGYNMICIDGWGDTSKINTNGYRTSHSRNWIHDYQWWSDHLRSRGMKLGMYANPLWLNVDASNTNATIVGTNLKVSSLYAADDPWWVQIDRPGAEAYVKGHIKHFKDMGIDYLRIDFLSWYETGTDRNFGNFTGTVPFTRAGGHPTQYATALRWMREAADEHGVFLSLVMPHLYNEAANEQLYGHMIRINEDAFAGGWSRWNNEARGIKRVGWSVFANPMDGLTYWSYIAGRGKMILDPDFIRLNTFENDEERKTVISICLLAGSPITPADRWDNLGRHRWLYINPEMLALNQDGFVGKPLTNDVTSPDSQIWRGQMSNGDWILGLFNREDSPQTRTFSFSQIGLSSARVRDLWQHADLGTAASLSLSIPAHGCRVFRLIPGASSAPGPAALRLSSVNTTTVAGASGGLRARGTWTVTDGTGAAVSGATLTAFFGGSFREELSGLTDSSGRVELTTAGVVGETPRVQVEVLDVYKTNHVYAADLNQTNTEVTGSRMFVGGTFTEWRLQDFPMMWKDQHWEADRIPLGTHLYSGMNNNYQLKFADDLYFLGNDWGGASGTNGTAVSSTFSRGTNITFSIPTNGLYRMRFNPSSLAYQISLDWATTDVGAVGIAGFTTTTPMPRSYVLHASGADIETTNDEFHFVWQSRTGDLDLQAKVTRLAITDPWAKAGLMIRSTTNANSRHASIFVTPDNTNSADNGVILQRRNSTGGTTTKINRTGISAPAWLRLKKSSTTFNAYYSTNGQGWTLLGTTNVSSIGTTFLVGLAACGHSDGTLTEALFEEVYLRTNSSSWFWNPASPIRGQTATLTYFAEGRSLTNSPDVLVRIRPNNGNEEITPTPAMTEISPDVWTLSYPVPSGATNLVFSFGNAAETTDSGGTVTTAAATGTPPPSPPSLTDPPAGQNPYPYVTGNSIKFTWNPVTSPDGLASLYRVTTSKNGITSTSLTGLTEISVAGEIGDQISVSIQPVHSLDFSQVNVVANTSQTHTFLNTTADQDGDGMSNSAEEIAGTNPMDARSRFYVTQLQAEPSSMTLTWTSVPGKSYRVQWSDNLATSFGSTSHSGLITASSGATTSWTDPNPTGSCRFYRIVVTP